MYGYDASQLKHIQDNTPSPVKVAILFIMILLIYIAYQTFLIIWDQKRMDLLLGYKRQLKKYKEAGKTQITNTKTEKSNPKKERLESRKDNPGDMFSDEELKILESLGK